MGITKKKKVKKFPFLSFNFDIVGVVVQHSLILIRGKIEKKSFHFSCMWYVCKDVCGCRFSFFFIFQFKQQKKKMIKEKLEKIKKKKANWY
jgi:hypothetical protein